MTKVPDTHVDFVKNDWAAEVQRKVGWADNTMFELHLPYPHDQLLEQVSEVFHGGGLRRLSEWFDGSYFFATLPHERRDCPFNDSDELPMITRYVGRGEEFVLPDA